MQIQLYRYSGENNRVVKNSFMSDAWVCEGTIKEDSSIINPIITIEKNTPPQNNKYNYAYIPEFKRYYYITDITATYNKMWRISMKVDVLYSFAQDILNTRCIIDKTSDFNKANMYLNDGSFVMDSHKFNQVIQFPSGLSDQGSNILICAGGL